MESLAGVTPPLAGTAETRLLADTKTPRALAGTSASQLVPVDTTTPRPLTGTTATLQLLPDTTMPQSLAGTARPPDTTMP